MLEQLEHPDELEVPLQVDEHPSLHPPLHVLEQPEHPVELEDPLHVDEQPVEHVPMHSPLHERASSMLLSLLQAAMLGRMAMPPKIGRTVFAAFLKNSLRLIICSFFISFSFY